MSDRENKVSSGSRSGTPAEGEGVYWEEMGALGSPVSLWGFPLWSAAPLLAALLPDPARTLGLVAFPFVVALAWYSRRSSLPGAWLPGMFLSGIFLPVGIAVAQSGEMGGNGVISDQDNPCLSESPPEWCKEFTPPVAVYSPESSGPDLDALAGGAEGASSESMPVFGDRVSEDADSLFLAGSTVLAPSSVLWVSGKPVSPPKVFGVGEEKSLTDALEMILPPGWTIWTRSRPMDLNSVVGSSVFWVGNGRPWPEVLDDLAFQYGVELEADVESARLIVGEVSGVASSTDSLSNSSSYETKLNTMERVMASQMADVQLRLNMDDTEAEGNALGETNIGGMKAPVVFAPDSSLVPFVEGGGDGGSPVSDTGRLVPARRVTFTPEGSIIIPPGQDSGVNVSGDGALLSSYETGGLSPGEQAVEAEVAQLARTAMFKAVASEHRKTLSELEDVEVQIGELEGRRSASLSFTESSGSIGSYTAFDAASLWALKEQRKRLRSDLSELQEQRLVLASGLSEADPELLALYPRSEADAEVESISGEEAAAADANSTEDTPAGVDSPEELEADGMDEAPLVESGVDDEAVAEVPVDPHADLRVLYEAPAYLSPEPLPATVPQVAWRLVPQGVTIDFSVLGAYVNAPVVSWDLSGLTISPRAGLQALLPPGYCLDEANFPRVLAIVCPREGEEEETVVSPDAGGNSEEAS